MSKFLRIYEFADKKETSVQNVYRWIREGKIPKDKIRVVEVTVKRIEISEDVPMEIRKKS